MEMVLPSAVGDFHLDQPTGSPVARLPDVPAEAYLAERRRGASEQVPTEPGRPVAADLPLEIERRERATRRRSPPWLIS